MADRRGQVILLLGSRFDGLYLPAGGLSTRAGLVPSERLPCESCGGVLIRDDFAKVVRRRKGRGWVLDGFKRRQPCSACGGSVVDGELVAGAGEVARDPMDALGVRVGSEATVASARPRRTVRCDACNGDGVRRRVRCERCDGVGRRDLHAFELRVGAGECSACGGVGCEECSSSGDPLTDAIEARDRSGSYRELDLALAGVVHHVNKPRRYQVLTRYAVQALRLLDDLWLPPASVLLEDLDEWSQELVERALEYLVWRMPDPIRVPADVQANAREHRDHRRRVKGRASSNGAVVKRDTEIRGLVRRGVPTQRVAFDYGLSVSQVNRIVAGQTEDAA